MKVIPIERRGHSARWLDQTRLPVEIAYCESADFREIIKAIKRLELRGAPLIGIAAAYGLALAAQEYAGDAGKIHRAGEELKAARPTAVNLAWAIERVLGQVMRAGRSDAEFIWSEAETIHEEDRALCREIGRAGAALIGSGARILTHCNTGALATGGIGTALGVIYTCRDQGKQVTVFADETRPLLQGARLTAWELQQEGIPVTLICDNTAGLLMQQKKIDCVIVGADRIARNGDTANKIGTYSVAVLAHYHEIPFYVAAPYSTFDVTVATGSGIVIEERAACEVTDGFGCRTAPMDVAVYSPAFDITPVDLVNWYITDRGLIPGGREGRFEFERVRCSGT